MFYLEAQQTIAQSPLKQEIEEGEVVVAEGAVGGAEATPKGGGKPQNHRRRKKWSIYSIHHTHTNTLCTDYWAIHQ